MKAKVINTVEVKEVGTINMENIDSTNGQITVHIPVISASKELEALLDRLQAVFMAKHPEVSELDVCFDVNVIYSFGGYVAGIGSEFVLDIYVWKDGNEDVVEEYDEIPLYMGEEGAKQITQRYIGIQSEEIEEALQNHIHLI